MSVIPQPPADINNCGVLRVLRRKSTEHDGVAALVQQFIAVATPMVDLVAVGPFRNYTLHNRDHAKKLLHLIDFLVPTETIQNLSILECLFIVYAAFLHDMGMAITSSERDRIIKSEEFKDTIRDWPEISHSIEQVRNRLSNVDEAEKPVLETLLFQLHEAALCAYLRPRHASPQRYKELIEHLKRLSNIPDLFSYKSVSFENWVIEICASHNLDSSALNESKSPYDDRFPRELLIAQEKVNTQFCAAILRLTDILDFDRERTPRVLFESLGIPSGDFPGADVSLREWEKHMSIHSIDIKSDEIVVSAECHHPAIEKSIREFCGVIERELRDTMAILKRNPQSVVLRYFLELPLNVRPSITSIGYSYRDVSLRLNQSAIMSLLMGDRLYSHSGVALRELIQNALDACEVRRRLGEPKYVPHIHLAVSVDSIGRKWIELTDNGIGMDDHVLGEYFLKLGDSYYGSSEFERQFSKLRADSGSFHPISRFGIGILSAFLLGDVLEVITKSAFSPRGDNQARLVRIERLGGLAFVANMDRENAGTVVRLRVRPEISSQFNVFAESAARYLQWLLVRPWFLMRVELGPDELSFYIPMPGRTFYAVSQQSQTELSELGYESVVIELSRWSGKLNGIVVLLFKKTDDGLLSHMSNGRRVLFQQNAKNAVNPSVLIEGYTGNRITVSGFRLRSFKSRSLMRFPSGLRLSFIIDIDAVGSSEIEFDVSRERLTKKGENFLRREINRAIISAVVESGTIEKMATDLRLMMDIPVAISEIATVPSITDGRPDPFKYMFEAVAKEIPTTEWPTGMHKQIATKLGVKPTLISKVISVMLKSGALTKPETS